MRAVTMALFLTLATGVPAAGAQDMTRLSSIYSAGVFDQAVIAVATQSLGSHGREAFTPASQSPLPDFTFRRIERVDSAARERLLASLLGTTTDPVAQTEIRISVVSDAVWEKFDSVLTMAGYSSRNLADVTAAYYIINWEVVTGGDAILHPHGVRAVRDAVAAALAADPRLASLSDAEMQETAVIMAYKATVAGTAARRLAKAGDEAGLERLRDAVRRSVRVHGVDLADLRLTDRGLIAR